ncbi:O-antigen ligase [Paenibacillus favisporus]|uniref:O-antigen polymerase n=1 Tax=Paenibacillus favisporus TaxID=221028 RepID=UPI002DB597F1|nr:O-antigen polymerase [Paenibacillus favisporus]MEC0178129.1 O-antigen ligase [Paenibacillus favisporus]
MKKTIWWLNPGVVFTFMIVPNVVIANHLSSNSFLNNWGTPKYLSKELFQVSIFSVLLFLIGSAFMVIVLKGIYDKRSIPRPQSIRRREKDYSFLMFFLNVSYLFTFFGYIYWLYVALTRGLSFSVLIGMLQGSKGAMYDLKHLFSTVSGITTFTQFGIVASILSVYVGLNFGWSKIKSKMIILLVITFFRAFFLSERLAALELVIPIIVCWLGIKAQSGLSGKTRVMVNLSPLIGLVVFAVYFSVTEYFRSWSNYYALKESSFIEFCVTRIAGYYVTGLNNGSMLIDVFRKPLSFPYFTTTWLWDFPILGSYLDANKLTGVPSDFSFAGTLASMGNPEFNNPSGLFLPYIDFGHVGGFFFWLIAGMGCGFIYHLFSYNNIYGYLYYPIIFVGLLESPRVLYWSEGRAFPAWLLVFFISFFLFIRSKHGLLSNNNSYRMRSGKMEGSLRKQYTSMEDF